ncbi:hypothetical protein GCM10010404_22590 [Nonomuraea africana]|uniref:hypothetical protein n=1 Tax=Nonomuraea africana TaxID=46171 RepID=UPI001CEF4581
MRAVVLVQQRQVVVAVMGRHRLVRSGQRVHSATQLESFEHQTARSFGDRVLAIIIWTALRGRHGGAVVARQLVFRRGESLAKAVQDVTEHAQEAFGLGAVHLP